MRNKQGQYQYSYSHTTFKPIIFLITTILCAKLLEYSYSTPEPYEMLRPGYVMAADSALGRTTQESPMPSLTTKTIKQEATKARVVPVNPYRAITERYATKYGVDANLVDCILFHESSYRADASNSSSSARGIAQFLKGTWVWMRTKMGADTQLNLREDVESATETLAWALSKGYARHWLVVTNGSCKVK